LRADDAADWLKRAVKRKLCFDLAILDPPSFSKAGRGTFSVSKQLTELVALTLRLLSPGGRLLVVTNHRKTSQASLRRMVHDGARTTNRQVRQMKDLASQRDCPPNRSGPEPSKSVWMEVA
jgi:23S rRNA (cytosine1962-C5)-methyltransferase